MAFKMNGSPAKMGTISGTAGHSSALKMKAEADAASALKQKEERETSWWRGEEGWVPDELQPNVNRPKVKTEHGKKVAAKKEEERKSEKTKYGTKTYRAAYDGPDKSKYKTQKEFNKAADDWWASDAGQKKASAKGSKFAHRIIKKEEPTTQIEKATNKAEKKVDKIKTKSAKKVAEVGENLTKKGAKYARKGAKKTFGKGSKEHLTAKKVHLQAKEADRQGAGGGKKQTIFRKISSKINKRRQEKIDKKLAEKE